MLFYVVLVSEGMGCTLIRVAALLKLKIRDFHPEIQVFIVHLVSSSIYGVCSTTKEGSWALFG